MIGFKIIISILTLAQPFSAFVPTCNTNRLSVRVDESQSSFQEDFIDKQKNISDGKKKEDADDNADDDAGTLSNVKNYLKHQQKCFDDMSEFFNSDEAIPPEVVPILHFMVKKALVESMEGKRKDENEDEDGINNKLRILDVGCGTGALFPVYKEVADDLGIELEIQGLDLSPKMTKFAQENGKNIVEDSLHSIACETGDFVQTIMGVEICGSTLTGFDNGVVDESTGKYRNVFDAVMINACFGNFFDTDSVITAAAACLKNDGVFFIGHPLGAEFVEKLGTENPLMVPNRLPSREALEDHLLQYQPMEILDLVEEAATNGGGDSDGDATPLYIASIKKKSHRMLREVVRLRGAVDQGYGRGGKKLGFPTANLPSSLFKDALADVPTGVYLGSALIEKTPESGKGRDVVHKAVVNVGYSPTFDGEENKEKIVEAHLIIEDGDIEGDFYGETMRLALCGFLRPGAF